MAMIYKLKDTTLKLSPEGTFEGYASLFSKQDMGNDIVLPGAFRESILKRGARNIKMLYQHNPAEPIGTWQSIKEDHIGLKVKGRLTLDASKAREVYHLMKSGALDGLSIGFHTLKARRHNKTGTRYLHKVDLWEISVVTFPMLESARINQIKQMPARHV